MPLSEDQIRELAAKLARKRPWCTPDENWLDAELQLNTPLWLKWRPCFLRWIGASDKTGWEWLDFAVKLSLPLAIASAGWVISWSAQKREQALSETNARTQVAIQYLVEMHKLLQDQDLTNRLRDPDSYVYKSVRSVTLQAIARLEGGYHAGHYKQRNSVINFLRETGLPVLEEANLSTLDLSGTNLNKLRLRRSDMRSVKLIESYMRESDVQDADLRNADLRGAYLNRANLSYAKLQKANLSASGNRVTDLRKAKLVKAKLMEADLSQSVLQFADLTNADLTHASLGHADLSVATFAGANLSGADLAYANLRKADLRGASLANVNLKGADLRDVRWDQSTAWPSSDLMEAARHLPPHYKLPPGAP